MRPPSHCSTAAAASASEENAAYANGCPCERPLFQLTSSDAPGGEETAHVVREPSAPSLDARSYRQPAANRVVVVGECRNVKGHRPRDQPRPNGRASRRRLFRCQLALARVRAGPVAEHRRPRFTSSVSSVGRAQVPAPRRGTRSELESPRAPGYARGTVARGACFFTSAGLTRSRLGSIARTSSARTGAPTACAQTRRPVRRALGAPRRLLLGEWRSCDRLPRSACLASPTRSRCAALLRRGVPESSGRTPTRLPPTRPTSTRR